MNRRDATKRFFLAHGCSFDDTEDLTQEVEIRLWQARSRGAEVNYRYWLRTCRSVLNDYLRRLCQQREIFVPLEEAMDSHAPSVEEGPRLCLDECLQLLSSEQQEVVWLHVVQGFTFVEIGEALGKDSSVVKKTYQRAIRRLRKYFTSPDTAGGVEGETVWSWGRKIFAGIVQGTSPFAPLERLYIWEANRYTVFTC